MSLLGKNLVELSYRGHGLIGNVYDFSQFGLIESKD